ncbi:MscL family protein [Luteipulveratus mongoliensis]|uniref:Mechanosensitive ion channel protein MscL n=1 Tax=Luteipulveratus mongoliensis TaxID=571913 RepID=A0A0K1JH02_9MICO|nr:MscL family protein [Luteipulveratus mongoliensis]AKU15865.1 mechanosensitive ion channel protein MscL [Luteipulveratus mongoliensis]
MKGFKDFILRGNLVELAVAFVMAAAFGLVVKAFVTVIMDLIGKAGGTPNFSNWTPGDVHVGALLTELVAFLILAAVVYFFVVKPYQLARTRLGMDNEDQGKTEVDVLTEIRDELRARG